MSIALVTALVPTLGDALRTVLDRVLPEDPQIRAKAEAEIRTLERDGTFADKADLATRLAQIEVNKADAGSGSNYRGGWRPFIGWTCGANVAWTFVLQPVATFALVVAGYPSPELPKLDTAELMTLLGILLGSAGLRTFEKVKGKA